MTPEQAQAVAVGDEVTSLGDRGRVSMCTRAWFMVCWYDGKLNPEIFYRATSRLVQSMQLYPALADLKTVQRTERKHRKDLDD